MASRYTIGFPSPQGVHVPETYYSSDPDDPYRRPPSRRNRYSRSGHQPPRIRDVTWISSPEPVTPQTPYAPPSPWIPPPQQVPSIPARFSRPGTPIPPSPIPTVGEHMTLDDFQFPQDDPADPYQRPQRPGLVKSFWKGLKKLSGFRPGPAFPIPRTSFYENQPFTVPGAQLSAPSEYVDPTPPESGTEPEVRHVASPYASPYARSAKINATPTVVPGSLRASPVPGPAEILPPVTIVSPSIPPSPRPNSVRSIRSVSARAATPGPIRRSLSVHAPEPGGGNTEEGSQTLHEHGYPNPALPLVLAPPIAVVRSDEEEEERNKSLFAAPSGGGVLQLDAPVIDRSFSNGSLASTMARLRRFVTDLDNLPWYSDEQIADAYVPEKNPRSVMRRKVRQGADPSWYNARPEVVERPAYWSEWDMWAKQSAAALLEGTASGVGRLGWPGVGAHGGVVPGQWGAAYPHGYVAAQPQYAYPWGFPGAPPALNERVVPVLPMP